MFCEAKERGSEELERDPFIMQGLDNLGYTRDDGYSTIALQASHNRQAFREELKEQLLMAKDERELERLRRRRGD
jgi:hypothetical protein